MRRALPAFCVLVLAGCFSLAEKKNPYLIAPPEKPTTIRTLHHTFALQMLSERRAASVSLQAFNTGTLRTRGEAVSALKSYNAKVKLDVPAFLIKHSKQGWILFGTGLSPQRERRPGEALVRVVKFLASFDYTFRYEQKKGRDIVAQLREEGISPAEIRWIIVPYWDAATVGMLDSFPGATVVVNRREWEWQQEAAAAKPGPLAPAVFAGKIKLQFVDMHNQPAFGAFENGVDFFGDGSLYLVSLSGRTPGSIGAWLNLDNGPVLLTGGAAFVVDNYMDFALPVKDKIFDLEYYWHSLHVIHAMRRGVPQVVVFPGNDLVPLRLSARSDISRGGK
ncbi:MAG: hypothetical protein ABIJ96_04205 [Elusimicrobiota bacterium]